MKKLTLILFLFSTYLLAVGPTNNLAPVVKSLSVSPNGTLLNPTNFFQANAAVLTASVNFGLVPIEAFGAKGGTNDDSAAFLAAGVSGLCVVLTQTNYTICTNILFTNNTSLVGNGNNTITAAASITNSALKFWEDNFRACDFKLEGGAIAFEGNGDDSYTGKSTGPHAWKYIYNADPELRYPSNKVDWQRNGIEVYSERSNGFVHNLYIHGFSGVALLPNGNGRSGVQPTNGLVSFSHIQTVDNWIGICPTNGAEYIEISDFHGSLNGIGCYVGSGNVKWTGGEESRDCLAVYIDGNATGNPAHGEFCGTTLNHNDLTVAGGYTSFGEVFTGCFALGGGDANISGHQGPCFCLVNMSGFKWDGGYMAPTDIKFDGNASAYPNSFTAYNTIRSFGTYTSPACVTTIINNAYAQIQIEPNDSTNVVMTNAFNQWFQGTVAINALNLGKTNSAPTFAAGTTVPRLWFPVTNGVTVFYLPGY